jgi:hypothetical protein
MVEFVAFYDENTNDDSLGLTHIITKREVWMEIEKITTKDLQNTLKVAINKVPEL